MPAIDEDESAALRRAVASASPGSEIAAVYLFGSRARGEAHEDSDVDLAVLMRPPRPSGTVGPEPSRAVFERLADRLAASVAMVLGLEHVDVIDLRAQGPLFAREVLADGVLLYEGDRATRVDFVAETLVRAIDFQPIYDRATHDRIARMRAALRRDGLVRKIP